LIINPQITGKQVEKTGNKSRGNVAVRDNKLRESRYI